MKSRISYLHLFYLLLIMLPGCSSQRFQTLKKQVVFAPKNVRTAIDVSPEAKDNHTITIWIHGTRLFDVAGALRNFIYSRPGLSLARDYEPRYHMHQIGKTLVNAAPNLFSHDTFYIFGWSGKLDFGVREQAAEHLYRDLIAVLEQYQIRHNVKPSVRIISHSHGGNVALNLARIPSKPEGFTVDELILLACPVQDKTASLIKDPAFKKIFCIYSQIDMCQILDPQGFYKNGTKSSHWLSGRYFPDQDNLEQVKIKMNGRSIFHSEFVFPRFLTFLADIINTMDHWHKEAPAEKPFTKFIKMLHVRTNGKPFKLARAKKNQPVVA